MFRFFTALFLVASASCTEAAPYQEDGTSTGDADVETHESFEEMDSLHPDPEPDWPEDAHADVEEAEWEKELCTIDLVFSVDNSESMQRKILAFREEVWPQFVDALLEVSGGLDGEIFRVAVIDACPDPANFHTRGKSGECLFESGRTWMESDSGDLVGEFQCVGDIWAEDANCTGRDDDEQPASAAATSLEPPWSAADGPNFGFLRDDALLIIIAITDEDEQPVPNASARDVYERLIAIKGGDPKKMVFLGIGGSARCEDGPYGPANEARKLKNLTNLFIEQDRGVFWDICEGRLEDGLSEAMTIIELACDELPLL